MNQLIGAQTKPIDANVLDRLTVPTWLLWGRHDRMVPIAIGQAAAERHGWPLHVIDGAAHAPHIENPSAFVDTLGAVLGA